MQIKSVQKFVRTSPRKLRLVADMIRELEPVRAVEVLPLVGKRAAQPLQKVIKTAIANAKQQGFSESDLTFKEIQINQGPTLKRGRPVSRGRWHPIKKRTSHIRVVLEAKKPVKKPISPKTQKDQTKTLSKENTKKTNSNPRDKKPSRLGRISLRKKGYKKQD